MAPKRFLTPFWGPEPWTGKVGSKGRMSVRAAITAITACDGLSDLLRTCVAFGGDVDTVAAIALSAASCCPRFRKDLPAALVEGLENGTYGRNYIVELDRRLLAAVRRQPQ